ncbi:hypothetical protein ACP70R_032729 [Stipagrostis hirtigluma subsp. patula]
MYEAITLRNEVMQEKEAVLRQKDEEISRKEAHMQTISLMYERRLKAEGEDKNRAWCLVFCLVGIIVSMLYGVVLQKLK